MIDLKKFDSKKLFKSKTAIAVVSLLGTMLIFFLVLVFLKDTLNEKEDTGTTKEKHIQIKTTEEVLPDDRMWQKSIEEKLNAQKALFGSKLSSLEEDVKDTKNIVENNGQANQQSEIFKKVEELNNDINSLRAKLEENQKVAEKKPSNKAISQFTMSLENAQSSSNYKPIKTAENYIPAGSFAKAVLLSGLDAATSLMSSDYPDPVLIRIVDHGTLPRRFKSDLKDCHIIGAAFGDLSSERAKVRLEKLSCTEVATGEIIETEVAGFVAGDDGRQGIRGEVVSTEGKLLGNSFLSGLLGGLANNFNPNTSMQPTAVISNKFQRPDAKERFQSSFATGASNSMDRLSKYYIERAENLQPVIQVAAGRKVDVIFTEGAFFGTSEIKRAIAKKRDEKIREKSDRERGGLVQSLR